MIHRDELPFLTQNKTLIDIQFMYEDLDDKRIIFRESCQNYLLNRLKEIGKREDNCVVFRCNYEVDCGQEALPEFQTSTITCIWEEDEYPGIVYIALNGTMPMDLDGLDDYELEQLIEQISK